LKKVARPTVVSAAAFKAKADQLAEAQAELDESEAEIRRLKKRLADTEALKDKTEVAALRGKYSDSGDSERFNALTDEVKKFRAVLKSAEVMKFVLSDHYGKPYRVNWYQDREQFEAAARFGFVEFEDGERVGTSLNGLSVSPVRSRGIFSTRSLMMFQLDLISTASDRGSRYRH
jgi:hypothetical protein